MINISTTVPNNSLTDPLALTHYSNEGTIGTLCWNCLSDSTSPFPSLSVWDLWRPNIQTRFTQWLVSCAEVEKEPGFDRYSHPETQLLLSLFMWTTESDAINRTRRECVWEDLFNQYHICTASAGFFSLLLLNGHQLNITSQKLLLHQALVLLWTHDC